jgi:hypothetical protein
MGDPDYLEPKYRLRQAADAAAVPLNTLRSNYQRGWFQSFGNGMASGRGRAQRLCLGDILVLAIASRLIDIGLRPLDAYNAARPFGQVGGNRRGVSCRMPFGLFKRDEFDSVFIWRRGSASRVVPVRKGQGVPLELLKLDDSFGEAAVTLLLNAVEATVFEALKLPLPGAAQ